MKKYNKNLKLTTLAKIENFILIYFHKFIYHKKLNFKKILVKIWKLMV